MFPTARRAFVCLFLLLFLSVPVLPQNGISYVYDGLGRLIAAIDPATDTVTYSYDSIGNLLSIARRSSSQVSIIDFTPGSGPVGTAVILYGTGFSATPSQNTVQFNGVAAAVASATATKIVTSVPAGATTGLISVTAPAGSANSATPFTVGSKAPSISSFSPTIGATGAAVTINGTDFEPSIGNNKATFGVTRAQITSATATAIAASSPRGGSGKITVSTPYGKAVSSADFFAPPFPNLATDVETTGRMTIGETRTVSVATSGKIAMTLFDGVAGQRISLRMASVTVGSTVAIYRPDGTTFVAAVTVTTAGGFIDTKTLLATGTYAIVIDPTGTGTGSITLTLYDVPPDVSGTIVPGGSAVTVTMTVPGQNAGLTFSGTAGQKVSLNLTGVTVTDGKVSINNPDGSALVIPTVFGASGLFIDTKTLDSTGTYTILIDPVTTNIGAVTLTLYNVVDVTGPVTPGGAAVPVSLTTPGQNGQLTFSGAASQRVSVNLSSVTIPNSTVSILKPDNTTLISKSNIGTSGSFLDTTTLPSTGTYTVLVNPYLTNTGNMTVSLYDVPPDITGAITPGGTAVTVSPATPGQNATLTFSGVANQKVSLMMTGVTISESQVSILNPDGTNLVNPTTISTAAFIDTKTLSVTGTYTIVVNPINSNTGNMTLTLYDAADATGTITPGGSAVTVTITTPGQNGRLTFTGAVGQKVSIQTSNSTIASVTVSLLNPDATTLGTVSSGFMDTKTLASAGAYTVLVNPLSTNTGSITITLHDIVDASGTLTVGGSAVSVSVGTPGQNAALTFSGTSGQQVTVRITSNVIGTMTVKLLKPDGAVLTSTLNSAASFNLATQTLATTGTHTIIIDPSGTQTGTTSVSVTNP